MGKRKVFTFKDTFWSKLRVEKNYTLEEIANVLGVSDSTIGQYLTGAQLPSDRAIHDLCDLFDVDYDKGALEFQRAHREWKAERDRRSLKYTSTGDVSDTSNKKCEVKIDTPEDILNAIYGKVSCADFIGIYNLITGVQTDVDPLAILYGKVDYETYYKIIKII